MMIPLEQFPMLPSEKRVEARNRAFELVRLAAGDRPRMENFQRHAIASLPPGFRRWVTRLAFVALLAAFFLSATRLFLLGYGHTLTETGAPLMAVFGGIAVVLLAEASQLIFLLAFADDERAPFSRRVMVAGALISTAIALSGNYQMADEHGLLRNLFDLLMTFGPPTLVLAVGWWLKDSILSEAKRRQSAAAAYNLAVDAHEAALNNPESHPDFEAHYANALWDAYQKTFAARMVAKVPLRTILPALDDNQRSYLITRELQSRGWYQATNSAAPVAPPRSVAPDDTPFGSLARALGDPESIPTMQPVIVSHNGNGTHASTET